MNIEYNKESATEEKCWDCVSGSKIFKMWKFSLNVSIFVSFSFLTQLIGYAFTNSENQTAYVIAYTLIVSFYMANENLNIRNYRRDEKRIFKEYIGNKKEDVKTEIGVE